MEYNSLRCALSDGSLLRITLLCAEELPPESTSWMTILIASASTDACLLGVASRSSKAGTGLGGGIVRNPAISGLEIQLESLIIEQQSRFAHI